MSDLNEIIETPIGKKRWSFLLSAMQAAEVLNTADLLHTCGDKAIIAVDLNDWKIYWGNE